MTGRSLTLEARRQRRTRATDNEQTMIQSLAVDVVRVPTLKKLELLQDGTALDLPFQPAESNAAPPRDSCKRQDRRPRPTTADGTTVTVNGKQTDTVNLSSGKNNAPGQGQPHRRPEPDVSDPDRTGFRRHCGAGGPCGRGCGAAQPGRHGHCAGSLNGKDRLHPRRYLRVRFDEGHVVIMRP